MKCRRIACRVDLDSQPEQRGRFTVYDCASREGDVLGRVQPAVVSTWSASVESGGLLIDVYL
jgi:hypothetical protein